MSDNDKFVEFAESDELNEHPICGHLDEDRVCSMSAGWADASDFRFLPGFPEPAGEPPRAASDSDPEESPALAKSGASLAKSSALLAAITASGGISSGLRGRGKPRDASSVEMFAAFLSSFGVLAEPLNRVEPARREEIEQMFPHYSAEQLGLGRAAVESDLRLHRAYHPEVSTYSVWDKLLSVGLSQEQLHVVLNAAACLRENFARHRGSDGQIDPEQKSNWLHTLDELDEVLESSWGAGPEAVVRAAMAMFGDAVKNRRNFMVHHLDGAQAALVVGRRFFSSYFDEATLAGIAEANREHQIGPPGLMARIYSTHIREGLSAERSARLNDLSLKSEGQLVENELIQLKFLLDLKRAFEELSREIDALRNEENSLTSEQREHLARQVKRRSEGPFITSEESVAIAEIARKLSNPFDVELEDMPSGGKSIRFSPREQKLLKRTGTEYWYVPHRDSPWYWASRVGIDADSKANYARIGGVRKLLRLNGPETEVFFQVATLDEALQSVRQSYAQAFKIMTASGQAQAESRLPATERSIQRAKDCTETWLRKELGLADGEPLPAVPFWNQELSYPPRQGVEREWWRIHRIPVGERSAAEQTFWETHRYDGLSDNEKAHYILAIRIRDYMVDQLELEQRIDADSPQDFNQVMSDFHSA